MTEIDAERKNDVTGGIEGWGFCGPECPIHPNGFTSDDTLKVTHHNFDQREIMIALKLLGIMASSLLLIGLMVTGLGISGIEI